MCQANEKDICLAIREMMEDSRAEEWETDEKYGLAQGEKTGIYIFIQSNRDDGTEDAVIADKLQKYYDLPQKVAQKFLRNLPD